MEAILSFIPVPVAVILMAAGFVSLAVGGIRLGYKATVKNLALDLVNRAETVSYTHLRAHETL